MPCQAIGQTCGRCTRKTDALESPKAVTRSVMAETCVTARILGGQVGRFHRGPNDTVHSASWFC